LIKGANIGFAGTNKLLKIDFESEGNKKSLCRFRGFRYRLR
jgi:hypothetical protein